MKIIKSTIAVPKRQKIKKSKKKKSEGESENWSEWEEKRQQNKVWRNTSDIKSNSIFFRFRLSFAFFIWDDVSKLFIINSVVLLLIMTLIKKKGVEFENESVLSVPTTVDQNYTKRLFIFDNVA